MKVGKAKYGGGKTSFKIKDGDNLFRILPPLGKAADSGKWYAYYRVEWGYKNSSKQNRPFLDVRKVNFKTKMVEVESAAYLRREALKKQLADVKEQFKAGSATREQVQDAVDLVKQFNLDAKYYVNAVDAEGKIGLLKLNSSFMKLLRAEIDKSTKAGKDPLAVENGIYFNFHRSNETGKLQDWAFSVAPLQREVEAEINGQKVMVKQDVLHTMDDAFISRLSSEAFELLDMYPTPTAEEVERMVKEGVTAIDEILGVKDSAPQAAAETAVEQRAEAVAETPVTNVTETVTETPVETAPAPVEVKESVPAPTAEEASSSAPAGTGAAMSDDDFLASIGAGN